MPKLAQATVKVLRVRASASSVPAIGVSRVTHLNVFVCEWYQIVHLHVGDVWYVCMLFVFQYCCRRRLHWT